MVPYLEGRATGGDSSVLRASAQRCTLQAARIAGWLAEIQSSRSPGTAPEIKQSFHIITNVPHPVQFRYRIPGPKPNLRTFKQCCGRGTVP